jgi:uncharacterized OB-fold protein
MPQSKHKRFGGAGYAVGHKFKKKDKRICERCGRSFMTDRLVAYCPECFAAKRAERRSHGFGGGKS